MEHIKLIKQRTHSFAFRQIGLYDKEKIKPHRYNNKIEKSKLKIEKMSHSVSDKRFHNTET